MVCSGVGYQNLKEYLALVSVFVGNLSYGTTEETLQAFFEDSGMSPMNVRIAYKDGSSRG